MLTPVSQAHSKPEPPFLFTCVKNAYVRLPFFLEYYRKLGIGTFFIVDNASCDETRGFLLKQKDVRLFETADSYQESNAGRIWTDQLMETHAQDAWCLTVDVDEFFLFPFCERLSLPKFCEYLETHNFQGVFSILLDFYNRGPLREAHYRPGDDVFSVCDHHDRIDSYVAHGETYFPFINVRGGARQRSVFNMGKVTSGPPQKKIPLVKYHSGFKYLYSTHGSSAIRLADVSGVLAHFKFFADCCEQFEKEHKSRDRKNPLDYHRYAKRLAVDNTLYDNHHSIRYKSPASLTSQGFMALSGAYFDHAEQSGVHIPSDEYTRPESHISFHDLIKAWSVIAAFQAQLPMRQGHIEAEYRDALLGLERARNHYSLAATRGLRKLLRRYRLISSKALPENMGTNFTLKEKMRYTYDSLWWDIGAPVRVLGRIYESIRIRFKR